MASETIQVSRKTAQAAAEWVMRLSDAEVSSQAQQACLRWRHENPEHEEAWQRALLIQNKMGLLPRQLGLKTLGREQRLSRRQLLNGMALLVMAGPAVYLGQRHLPWQRLTTQYFTAVGQQKRFVLEDGTELFLNTNTWSDISFDGERRQIQLHRGEVFIRTGKDALQRPFEVVVDAGRVIPVGTEFNVLQHPETGVTEVRVFQGEVELVPALAGVRETLGAGYKSQFNARGVMPVEQDSQPAIDWIHGVLQVENVPLSQLLGELGRYRRGWLRCDPEVAGLRVSGAFQLADTNQVLNSLAYTLPVQVVFRSDYWVTVLPAA